MNILLTAANSFIGSNLGAYLHEKGHTVIGTVRKAGDPSECVMIAGRKIWQLVGHFPPSQSDPVLRLVFPREVNPADKSVLFRLYLPGVAFPEREVEFRTRDLMYHGKLEM